MTGRFWWYSNEDEPFDPQRPAQIPGELFGSSDPGAEYFATDELACKWLNDRCLAYGRAEAAKLTAAIV